MSVNDKIESQPQQAEVCSYMTPRNASASWQHSVSVTNQLTQPYANAIEYFMRVGKPGRDRGGTIIAILLEALLIDATGSHKFNPDLVLSLFKHPEGDEPVDYEGILNSYIESTTPKVTNGAS